MNHPIDLISTFIIPIGKGMIIMQKENNKDMHKEHRQRLRQRFINEGLDNFEDHNVLELLLFYSIPQKDTNETAHYLLNRFGSISEVFEAPVSELMQVEGVGERSAVLISLIPQIFRRYTASKADISKINGISEIAKFVSKCFVGMTSEHFLLICVDNKGNMLNHHFVSEGTVDSSSVDLRKIIQILVGSNATAAVIAHNHPRGNSNPSKSDLKTTLTVATALKPIGVKLLDHVIVSVNDYTSMAEHPKQFGCYFNPI